MMDWNNNWDLGEWLAMASMMILVCGAFFGVVVLAIATVMRRQRRRSDEENPGRTLDQRFASGELTEEDYLRARSMLAAHADSPKPG